MKVQTREPVSEAQSAALAWLRDARGDHVVFFDGVCALCNGGVRFLGRHDHRRQLRFVSLQHEFAPLLLERHGIDLNPSALATVYVLLDAATPRERLCCKSTAVIEVLRRLGGFWKLVACLYAVPRPLRDALYAVVARVRYRLFGKVPYCELPMASGISVEQRLEPKGPQRPVL